MDIAKEAKSQQPVQHPGERLGLSLLDGLLLLRQDHLHVAWAVPFALAWIEKENNTWKQTKSQKYI